MSWDFETDPAFQAKLDWADEFVRSHVEPLDLVLGSQYDKSDARSMALARPLQQLVRDQGLWAAHLTQDLGGGGYGQLPLALLNEILGRSRWAPTIFGCQAPDSGNAEILAHFGTPDQKARFLAPLLAGEISSAFSMTEPRGGSDPTMFTTSAVRDRAGWVLQGEKWFTSSALYAEFLLVLAVTDPDAAPHARMSMFVVPRDTPGVEIIRSVGVGGQPLGTGTHSYLRYSAVQLSADALLGEPGQGFLIAQTRLGGGRVHHAMRTVAQVRVALTMMCERALARQTRRGPLSSLGVVQQQIAESWIELEQFRLLVLRTAWLIDKHNDYAKVRGDIAAVKAAMPKVYHDVVQRAMHLHGALGVSDEMPFFHMLMESEVMGIADGPTEVHQVTLAKQILKQHSPASDPFPQGHLPTRLEAAHKRVAEMEAEFSMARARA